MPSRCEREWGTGRAVRGEVRPNIKEKVRVMVGISRETRAFWGNGVRTPTGTDWSWRGPGNQRVRRGRGSRSGLLGGQGIGHIAGGSPEERIPKFAKADFGSKQCDYSVVDF